MLDTVTPPPVIGGDSSPMPEVYPAKSKATVKSVKNSLKFKAQPRKGLITVKIGNKKVTMPIEARVLEADGFAFVSFPSAYELGIVTGTSFAPILNDETAASALSAIGASLQTPAKKAAATSIPEDVAKQAKAFIQSLKAQGLTLRADGTVVKTRKKRVA
jgi:hypothetical protein